MTTRLDISVGPVQGFVAQSRRTRDLWGSSYLLSFLSAHCLHGAQSAGGGIVRPDVESDPLFQWVSGRGQGDAPRIGSVPNHFVLKTDTKEKASRAAEAGIQALEDAWKKVCDTVWERFVKRAALYGNATEGIWQRQVTGFWEITWTAGPDCKGGLLARRKHWRSHCLPDEPGDKCTVMPDMQELSGHVGAESRDSREKQNRFWESIRKRLGPLDLRPDERLCAVALVKRLFPKVAHQALAWHVDAAHWPSTGYVAAVPWLRKAISVAPQQAREYAEVIQQRAPQGILAEKRPPFAGLNSAVAGDFARLDANYLNREYVKNERVCPLREDAEDGTRDKLACLLQAIYDVKDEKDETGRPLRAPPSFYALLLADGDRLGKLVGELGGQAVGHALLDFTGEVQPIVKKHDGLTVYAGGDDVLAMLPVPQALSCAACLASRYQVAFPEKARPHATLSAAVAFAHVRLPLNTVIKEAHRLLDEVAKDGNGRNSLAVGVLKPGGLNCQWTTTWTRRKQDDDSVPALQALDDLVEHVKRLATHAAEPGLSSSLIYRVREMVASLCGWDRWEPGAWGELPTNLDLRKLLQAEIFRSVTISAGEEAASQVDELANTVWNLLGPSRRVEQRDFLEMSEAGIDALLLARFLVDPESEETAR